MPAEHPVFALELHGVTVRCGGQQIGYRPLMGSGKFGVRIQRRPGSQHKRALPSTRMGQCQIRIRAGDAIKVDNVQVQRPGIPMILTNSPMVRLDALQRGEQFVAAHCGFKLHHGVQEIRRTVGHAPRGRAVKR